MLLLLHLALDDADDRPGFGAGDDIIRAWDGNDMTEKRHDEATAPRQRHRSFESGEPSAS